MSPSTPQSPPSGFSLLHCCLCCFMEILPKQVRSKAKQCCPLRKAFATVFMFCYCENALTLFPAHSSFFFRVFFTGILEQRGAAVCWPCCMSHLFICKGSWLVMERGLTGFTTQGNLSCFLLEIDKKKRHLNPSRFTSCWYWSKFCSTLTPAVFLTCYMHYFAWWFQHWWLQLQLLVMQWLRCPLTPSSSLCHLWEQASPPALQIQSIRSVILRKRLNKDTRLFLLPSCLHSAFTSLKLGIH